MTKKLLKASKHGSNWARLRVLKRFFCMKCKNELEGVDQEWLHGDSLWGFSSLVLR